MADGGLSFDPDTLEPIQTEGEEKQESSDSEPVATVSGDAPIVQEKSPRPIPWPVQQVMEQVEVVSSKSVCACPGSQPTRQPLRILPMRRNTRKTNRFPLN